VFIRVVCWSEICGLGSIETSVTEDEGGSKMSPRRGRSQNGNSGACCLADCGDEPWVTEANGKTLRWSVTETNDTGECCLYAGAQRSSQATNAEEEFKP